MNLNYLAPLGALMLAACGSLPTAFSSEVVYVVEASGGAWSAGVKAREAMNSIDGISDLHMSGARAVFDLEGNPREVEAQIAAAFEEREMKLESFSHHWRLREQALYRADSEITWAVTAGKVREALMKEAGALDVYFEDTIEIVVNDPDDFSIGRAKEVLAESEVEFTTLAAAPR